MPEKSLAASQYPGWVGSQQADILEYMDASRNAAIGYCNLQKGENVLIVYHTFADPLIVEAFALVASEVGAKNVIRLCIPKAKPENMRDYPPLAAKEAMKGADLILSVVPGDEAFLFHSQALQEVLLDYPSRHLVIGGTGAEFAHKSAKMPMELFGEISKRLFSKYGGKKKIHYTDPKGTDMKVTCYMTHETYRPMDPWRKFSMGTFPPAEMGWSNVVEANGVIYFDGMSPVGITEKPIKLTIEDGVCTKFEGAPEARYIEKIYKMQGGEFTYTETAFGINPKTPWMLYDPTKTLFGIQRHTGVMHAAIGKSVHAQPTIRSPLHCDGTLLKPTLYVGEECVIDDGHFKLLDELRVDPEFRKLAKKYGDPDELLTEEYA